MNYDLNLQKDRQAYFEAKIPQHLSNIRKYLQDKTFIAYLVAKKAAGKGTYTQFFKEIFGGDNVVHLSVGDMVRNIEKRVREQKGYEKELLSWLKSEFPNGSVSPEQAIELIKNRDTKVLMPTDLVLAFLKKEMLDNAGKTIFLDGFPRDLDQIPAIDEIKSLEEFRDDPDFFITIDVPEEIIDLRIKNRVVCPVCGNSKNLLTNRSEFVMYDKDNNEYYYECDNPNCSRHRLIRKEGDEKGIENIRERLDKDGMLMAEIEKLPERNKLKVVNHIDLDRLGADVDEDEVAKKLVFSYDHGRDSVNVGYEPLIVKDDSGKDVYSLMSAAAVKDMLTSISQIL